MRRPLPWLAAGAVLGLIAAGPWQARSDAGTGPSTIRITDKDIAVSRVDVGARGTSAGDTEIVRAQLFNRRITTKPIGTAELVCTFVAAGRLRTCRGTYSLPRGRIIVGGNVSYRQFYELAVLGGTGLFDNARGSATVTRTARKPARHLIVVRLVG